MNHFPLVYFCRCLQIKLSLRYEFNRWSTAWYVHHLYEKGYTNDGQVMGHWAGGERNLSLDTPAHVHAVNLVWQLSSKQILDTTFRHIKNNNETGLQLL